MINHERSNGIAVYRSDFILLLLIMMVIPSIAVADTMFRANAEHTDVSDNGGIAPTNTLLWRFQTGDDVSPSPAVAEGVVYIGSSDKNLDAIDAVMGLEKWRFTTGAYISSSLAVVAGVVYVGSGDDNLLPSMR